MALLPLLLVLAARGQVELPVGVTAVWDLGKAWREATPTRERVCLNGLWRWQPEGQSSNTVPKDRWGWFKVPGCWPGISDYMQKDCQAVYANPAWKNERLDGVKAAWYQREFTVPASWGGRQLSISASYVNSLATVFVDDVRAGDITFPAGDVDLTKLVKPGEHHRLSIEVVALPLKGVMMSYSDTNSAKQMAATVNRRGLCGDVFLVSRPARARIDNVKIEPAVQKWSLTVRADLAGLDPDKTYRLRAKVSDHGQPLKTIESEPFKGGNAFAFSQPWKPSKLWDLNTPQNQYDLSLELLDSSGKALDIQAPKRFGFRELWIKGRDFILNGTRVFFSCVPVDNAAVSVGMSSYEAAKESFRRLKSFGINMVYTHNYDCNPGSFLSFDEILQAADDTGVLVALTQPHFGDYDWSKPDSDITNGYARHAQFFVHVAANHPSVIAYATSHNATGYNEDTNPDMIDGINADRDSWAQNNVQKALRAQAIINHLDPERIVYHHSSGNLGTMHTMNFYLNFVPIQELDDWYEHWATVGVKPAFMVEYGVPFSWDWGMYRGWYKGQRSFGNAQVPWEYCMAEWNAQFLGDSAYNISEAEKKNLRWEANKFKTSEGWYRWDYPYPMGSTDPAFEDQQKVWAEYTTDNWRAFRTWGVSGISPWETFGVFWRLKDGVNRGRVELKTDWDKLQKPGYSPDYIDGRYERRDMAYADSDWVPTTGGLSLIRNNRPLLAYIGGKPGAFTDKAHDFRAGDTVEKQLIVVNNSRESVTCKCTWKLEPLSKTPTTGSQNPTPLSSVGEVGEPERRRSEGEPGEGEIRSKTERAAISLVNGQLANCRIDLEGTAPSGAPSHGSLRSPISPAVGGDERLSGFRSGNHDRSWTVQGALNFVASTGEIYKSPITFSLPPNLAPGQYKLTASIEFVGRETQTDEFIITALQPLPKVAPLPKLAVYDPAGETTKLLTSLGVNGTSVSPTSNLSGFDALIVGKHALMADGPGLDLSSVRTGLKVIMFEQSSEVLEKRFGFRVQEYGLRNVFPRVPDHPVLAGLDTESLRDWRGSATNMAPRGTYELAQQFNGAPSVVRSGILEPRVWRCGNRGGVASVLIEKPAIGDFLPIVDGGFSLQYSPLMEYHEGTGMVVFCQMDVTGRTESDPAAERLITNLLNYASAWKPGPEKRLIYKGDPTGMRHLLDSGFNVRAYDGKISSDEVVVTGPDATDPQKQVMLGILLCPSLWIGQNIEFINSHVSASNQEYINSTFPAAKMRSVFQGVGPADVYNRDPRKIGLVSELGDSLKGGVLARFENPLAVFFQLAPWTFDVSKPNTKRVFRHTSFALSRVLGNMGVHASTPLIERFASPVKPGEQRWLKGFYLDTPVDTDDPYRFFGW